MRVRVLGPMILIAMDRIHSVLPISFRLAAVNSLMDSRFSAKWGLDGVLTHSNHENRNESGANSALSISI